MYLASLIPFSLRPHKGLLASSADPDQRLQSTLFAKSLGIFSEEIFKLHNSLTYLKLKLDSSTIRIVWGDLFSLKFD